MKLPLLLLIFCSGMVALSWEVVWQLLAGLSLGVSAAGTALTLVATMGGLSLGSLCMGRALRDRRLRRPTRAYALLEVVIGLAGLTLLPGFRLIEQLDAMVQQDAVFPSPLLHLGSILLLLGPPTLAMGATIPVFGELAAAHRVSVARLYATNTAGAALGVLLVSFVVLPALGVSLTISLGASLNLLVALVAWLLPASSVAAAPEPAEDSTPDARRPTPDVQAAATGPQTALLLAGLTGWATFVLEVAWFRALRAAFQSTTDSFALMLFAVLLPLALGAALAPWLRARGLRLPWLLAAAGIAVLLVTPLLERADLLVPMTGASYGLLLASWLGLALLLIGIPILLLGTVFPWLLAEQRGSARLGRLYAVNTLAAVVGSLMAAWLLLPAFGFPPTAWLTGGLLLVAALALPAPHSAPASGWAARIGRHGIVLVLGLVALGVALGATSGLGRLRVQGRLVQPGHRVLAHTESPDSSIAVVEYRNGDRVLVIDGFETSAQTAGAHYMAWMGRLPMLLHPAPEDALVICFGTGQTAAAVWDERPDYLGIVELSQEVLELAPLFPKNEGILEHPLVQVRVMDGRAWLRRTSQRYDVATLEPMPPTFAGVNALYSREFYELLAQRMNPGGLVSQWVPFHITPPRAAAAIVATFQQVFPDSLLWIDPHDRTGILVGRLPAPGGPPALPLGSDWPGLTRQATGRDLAPAEIRTAVVLDPAGLARYAALGEIITDDNQLLAFGPGRRERFALGEECGRLNLEWIARSKRNEE